MHFAQAVRKSHRVFAPHHSSKRRYSHSHNASQAQRPPRIVWPADAKPTPYQVLGVDAGQHPYEKTNFVRLVKLYHPDMHRHHDEDAIAPAARLHRYHLVVAAHELLSDPARRRRYDLYKLGWMSHYVAPDPAPAAEEEACWRQREYTRAHDAEDGGRASPMRQAPIYMSNHAFAVLALVLAFGYAVFSCESVRRAAWKRRRGAQYVVDGDAVRTLYGAEHLVRGRSKDERILDFLCRRHVAAGGRAGKEDVGGFVPLDRHWEQNMCRH